MPSGLDRETATQLIAAFLLSSFGHLQFEIAGYNREGVLALEEHQMDDLRIFDPRWIQPANRIVILEAFHRLPYPSAVDDVSSYLHARDDLDDLLAAEIVARNSGLNRDNMVAEVHAAIEDWVLARQS